MLTKLSTAERANLAEVVTMLRSAAEFGYPVADAAVNYEQYYSIVGPHVWEHAVAIVTAEFPPKPEG